MKLLNKWLNVMPPVLRRALPVMASLYSPVVVPNAIGVTFNLEDVVRGRPADVQPSVWNYLIEMYYAAPTRQGRQAFELLNLWAVGHTLTEGLKVYCPTATEFEAFTNVEMRLPWSEYRQPFRSMVIAIPDDVQLVRAGQDRPACIIIRYDESAHVISVVVPTLDAQGHPGAELAGQYAVREGDRRTIEEYIGSLPDDLTVDQREDKLVNRLVRVAINANLLLSNKGAKRIGAANPDYEAKLRKSLDKKTLPESVRKANEQALRELPIVYGFEQHVRVYEQEGGTGAGGEGGHNVRPHWRRGHWAHQRHGPAGSLRKLIFRPAVMVNATRFGGELGDTKAVYTTAGSGA